MSLLSPSQLMFVHGSFTRMLSKKLSLLTRWNWLNPVDPNARMFVYTPLLSSPLHFSLSLACYSQKTKTAKKCAAGTPFIEKGSVRVGSLDDESGTYGRWMHLDCWRVPVRIWQGLPHMTTDGGADQDEKFAEALASMNEVLFCGFSQLNDEQKALIIEHVKNRENWARAPGKKVGGDEESTAKRKKGSSSGNKGNEQPEESLVAIKEEKPTVTTKKQQRAGKKRAAPLDEEDEHHEDEVYGVKIKSEPKSRRAAAAAPKRGRAATAAAVAAVEAYISNENIMIDQNAASPPPPVKKEKKVRAKKSKTASTIPLSSSSQPPPHTSSSSSSSQAIAIYEKKQQSQEHQVAPVDGGSSSRFMVPKPGVSSIEGESVRGERC